VTGTLAKVRAHLRNHFAEAGIDVEPDAASVTFLGADAVEVLRLHPAADRVVHYVSLGCSRHPMVDPTEAAADRLRGPRAEVVLRLRAPGPISGLARSLAVVAATPAVEGVVLTADALIDLSSPLWAGSSGPAPFTAVLLGRSDIPELPLEPPRDTRHRDRSRVDPAQGRRCHARGVAGRRCRRAGCESSGRPAWVIRSQASKLPGELRSVVGDEN
jgi:hypothetical protein